jgi:UDP-glucose 4-epimerase
MTPKILLTGGAGLIGSHIIDQLQADPDFAGSELVVLDNFSRGREANIAAARARGPVTLLEGDVRDPETVRRAMEGVELVFHLAAIRITQCAQEPRLAMEVLGDGTFNTLEAAVDAGVKKVVASSSASVYGLAETFPTPENHHPYDNRTIYGALKTWNEGLLRSFNDMYGLDYVALRYFNVYGPRMDVHGKYTEVLIRWIERIDSGQSPIIFGDGLQTMDFVYVEDIAKANLLAAKAAVTDSVYNIGRSEEISLKDLAEALLRVMDADLPIEYGPERAVNPVSRRLADICRTRADLGWEPAVDLDEGLRRLVAWWKAERAESNHGG